MDTAKFFLLLLQSIVYLSNLDEATRERLKREQQLMSWEMAQLGQVMEQKTQEQSGFAWGALLFSALQQRHFWAIAGVIVLLFGLCWRLWKRSRRQPASSSQEDPGKQVDTEEHEEKPSLAWDVGRISVKRLLDLSEGFTMVEDLVDELLCICRKRCRNSLVPTLKSVIGVGSDLGGWGAQEDDAVYRLLVPLKPPHGHAFQLELGTAGEMPTEYSCFRVELECTCPSELLAKDTLCFLHHPKEMQRKPGPSLLGTLCTGPYLDIEKTAHWFQNLVKDAWVVLPQSRHCRLTVLPARGSCQLRLTDGSNSTVLIQVMFGVLHGDSYIFLSTE